MHLIHISFVHSDINASQWKKIVKVTNYILQFSTTVTTHTERVTLCNCSSTLLWSLCMVHVSEAVLYEFVKCADLKDVFCHLEQKVSSATLVISGWSCKPRLRLAGCPSASQWAAVQTAVLLCRCASQMVCTFDSWRKIFIRKCDETMKKTLSHRTFM